MPEPQQVQQGAGTAEQLPQGEATALNEAMPTGTELAASGQPDVATQQPATDTAEPDMAQPSDYEPIFQPENDGEAFLTGPTTRPDEPVTTGAFSPGTRQLPAGAGSWMPAFVEAASLPDAPPQLKALVALLTDAAES